MFIKNNCTCSFYVNIIFSCVKRPKEFPGNKRRWYKNNIKIDLKDIEFADGEGGSGWIH
jgi:hypothetical protein